MSSFSELMDTKYALERQKTQSEANLQGAQADLVKQQTALAPGDAAARNATNYAAARQSNALAGKTGTETGLLGPQSAASINLTNAQAGEAAGRAAQDFVDPSGIPGYKGGTADVGGLDHYMLNSEHHKAIQGFLTGGFMGGADAPMDSATGGDANVPGYLEGKTQVNAPGDGTVDTKTVNLANGEAVLNKAAAEHLGRDTIGLLNALGQVKMGTVNAPGGAGQPQGPETKVDDHAAGGIPGYASGSSGVGTAGSGVGSGIDPIAGQGGTWNPPPTTGGSGNTSLREGLGMGVPRPAPIQGYAKGTADVKADKPAKGGMPMGMPNSPSMGDQGVREGDTSSSPVTQKGGVPGYAKGTAKVGKGKPPKGRPEAGGGGGTLNPAVLSALMHMSGMGGAGGMPPGPMAPNGPGQPAAQQPGPTLGGGA